MFGLFKKNDALTRNIHIQGDFVCYGYGGFYTAPKGWGMDVCYINRADFPKSRGARKVLLKHIRAQARRYVENGRASEMFLPHFIRRLHHVSIHERQLEKCNLLYERFTHIDAIRRFPDFVSFAADCIGSAIALPPGELAQVIETRIRTYQPGNIDEIITSQAYRMQLKAEEVMKKLFADTFGSRDGEELYETVYATFISGGRVKMDTEQGLVAFYTSDAFVQTIRQFHQAKMRAYTSEASIEKALKLADVKKNPDKRIKKARKECLRAFTEMTPELSSLVRILEMPVFVATDNNAAYFSNFFSGIPLVLVRGEDSLRPYTVYGLCMYQPYSLGGIIITHGGRNYERFWHTAVEELSHLADGPTDRDGARGYHRYSGTTLFNEALKADRDSIDPWKRTGILGAKEWGQVIMKRQSRFAASRIQKRIEAFDAALDFDHYAPSERNAEIFAALPIVERAVGAKRARAIMPKLFAFYDREYLPALKKEVAELKARITAS